MDRDKNLEQTLRDLDTGPGERVKHAVMDEFATEFSSTAGKNFWYKAVPLYKAVAAAALIALVSALTGGYVVSLLQDQQVAPAYAESSEALVSAPRLQPVIAVGDAF
jgi:hypothetical protein